jgi:hypothetical protein
MRFDLHNARNWNDAVDLASEMGMHLPSRKQAEEILLLTPGIKIKYWTCETVSENHVLAYTNSGTSPKINEHLVLLVDELGETDQNISFRNGDIKNSDVKHWDCSCIADHGIWELPSQHQLDNLLHYHRPVGQSITFPNSLQINKKWNRYWMDQGVFLNHNERTSELFQINKSRRGLFPVQIKINQSN